MAPMRPWLVLALLLPNQALADPCVEHRPASDVAYQADPGVDADAGGFHIDPNDVEIAIEVPLRDAETNGKPTDFDATLEVGTIALEDGRITFDGRALPSACQ